VDNDEAPKNATQLVPNTLATIRRRAQYLAAQETDE
jgi:hypothetical protein